MKRILYIIAACLTIQSCNYLDFDEQTGTYSQEDMYDLFSNIQGMLTEVYTYMPQDFCTIDYAMRDCGSDDAEFADVSGTIQAMNNGTWSATNTIDTRWTLYYGVRAANEFLAQIYDVDLTRFQYYASYTTYVDKMQYFSYEARVLRAHYFFELARRYGDIPMPLTELSIDEANSISKTSFKDVIDFIVAECEDCATNLPTSYISDVTGAELGRMTKGFALAVKAKALLYAASPLHSTHEWVEAARAAKDIIDLNVYELDPDGAISGNNNASAEIILPRLNPQTYTFELYNFPIRFTNDYRSGSIYGVFPTQNLVDEFQTEYGYAVTLSDSGEWVSDDPAFDASKPYASRDPRFARTVLSNGDSFKGETIETFEGGADDFTIDLGGSATGYFLRKYIQETSSFETNATVTNYRYWVVSRYAETLLSYAEAMNEAYGPSYTDAEFTLSAIDAVNLVRDNVGMPLVQDTPAYAGYSAKATFRKIVQSEWRVEFAFEDHRFWDVRRWKIGSETTEIAGVVITKDEADNYTYARNLYETRVWNDKMNLYPIPQSELAANSNLYPQNLGW